MANNYVSRNEFNELVGAVNDLAKAVNQLIGNQTKTSKKSAPKTAKKSDVKPKQTRSERLEESYGTLEERTAYIEFKKSVMAELKALGQKNGKWIPKGKKYNEALKKAMEVCKNQKLNKTEVKKVWTAYAK